MPDEKKTEGKIKTFFKNYRQNLEEFFESFDTKEIDRKEVSVDDKTGKYYTETYAPIWNQYQYIAKGRENLERRFQTLLIVTSIYVATYFGIMELHKVHKLNYILLIVTMLVIILLLYKTIIRFFWVPWVGVNEYNKFKKSADVHKDLIEGCFKTIHDIRVVEKTEKRYIKFLILFLLFLILFPIIPVIYVKQYSFYFFSNEILIGIILGIIINLEILFYKKFDTFLTKDKEYDTVEIPESGKEEQKPKEAEEEKPEAKKHEESKEEPPKDEKEPKEIQSYTK